MQFEDIDALARYVAKVTGIHRTTLKLSARIDNLQSVQGAIAGPNASEAKPVVPAGGFESAFQDTAFALLQLIEHLNKTAGSEIIQIDEEATSAH